ncbi:MAG TPA: nuclear transport factor 2 family protein [Candidatus Limnocylindrales bacterium]|nr:nuclear transport factor 2 family protein [Candidatus Limnocylindrales bacterium]
MTRDDVQAWLDRYVAAWASYDPAAIGDLFTDDATYRFHPSDPGFRGREAIVGAWLDPTGDASSRDEPGTWQARYEPFTVDGDRAVAIGSSRYFTDASRTTTRDVWDNCYLLEFGPDGRCRSFTEWYVPRPADRL